jgi:hypothetical protein
MDEFEMNYIFNELDTILELIHANCIVRNVRHILISTAVKTLILENVYVRFFIRTEKKKCLFACCPLKITVDFVYRESTHTTV